MLALLLDQTGRNVSEEGVVSFENKFVLQELGTLNFTSLKVGPFNLNWHKFWVDYEFLKSGTSTFDLNLLKVFSARQNWGVRIFDKKKIRTLLMMVRIFNHWHLATQILMVNWKRSDQTIRHLFMDRSTIQGGSKKSIFYHPDCESIRESPSLGDIVLPTSHTTPYAVLELFCLCQKWHTSPLTLYDYILGILDLYVKNDTHYHKWPTCVSKIPHVTNPRLNTSLYTKDVFFLRGGFPLGPQDLGLLAHCPIPLI